MNPVSALLSWRSQQCVCMSLCYEQSQWRKQTYSLLKDYIKTNTENVLFVCSSILSWFSFVDLLFVITVWWEKSVLMMMRKTIFDVLKRNFADFKPGPHINISNVYLYCQTCRITISACHWLNTSTFNVTLMVRVALKIILQPAVKSWIINQKHVNISLMFKNTIMSPLGIYHWTPLKMNGLFHGGFCLKK